MAEEPNVDYGEAPVSTSVITQNSATLDQLVKLGESIYKEVIEYCKARRAEADNSEKPAIESDFADTASADAAIAADKSATAKISGKDKLEQLKFEKELRENPRRVSAALKKKRADGDDDNPFSSEYAVTDKDEYTFLVKRLQNDYKDFNASFPVFIRWTVQTGEFDRGALEKFLKKHAITRLRTMEDFLDLQVDYVGFIFEAKHKHYDTAKRDRLKATMRKALSKEQSDFKKTGETVEKDMKEWDKTAIDATRRMLIDALIEQRKAKQTV